MGKVEPRDEQNRMCCLERMEMLMMIPLESWKSKCCGEGDV